MIFFNPLTLFFSPCSFFAQQPAPVILCLSFVPWGCELFSLTSLCPLLCFSSFCPGCQPCSLPQGVRIVASPALFSISLLNMVRAFQWKPTRELPKFQVRETFHIKVPVLGGGLNYPTKVLGLVGIQNFSSREFTFRVAFPWGTFTVKIPT